MNLWDISKLALLRLPERIHREHHSWITKPGARVRGDPETDICSRSRQGWGHVLWTLPYPPLAFSRFFSGISQALPALTSAYPWFLYTVKASMLMKCYS